MNTMPILATPGSKSMCSVTMVHLSCCLDVGVFAETDFWLRMLTLQAGAQSTVAAVAHRAPSQCLHYPMSDKGRMVSRRVHRTVAEEAAFVEIVFKQLQALIHYASKQHVDRTRPRQENQAPSSQGVPM